MSPPRRRSVPRFPPSLSEAASPALLTLLTAAEELLNSCGNKRTEVAEIAMIQCGKEEEFHRRLFVVLWKTRRKSCRMQVENQRKHSGNPADAKFFILNTYTLSCAS